MFLEINLVYIQIFRSGIYSEPCQTSMMKYSAKLLIAVVVFANHFPKISFSHSLLILIKIHVLLQKYLFLIKKYRGPG